MVTEHRIDIRGCQVAYQRGGKGEPLLLLHGMDGRASWDSVLSRLTEHHDVILPDHPGFGSSGSGEWIDGMADLALFYLDVLDALQIESCHLAGHCLGGWLAAEIAVMQPQRFKSLSLCAAAGIRQARRRALLRQAASVLTAARWGMPSCGTRTTPSAS